MNWLAHIFLSEQHIDFQLGNFLADPLKTRLWNHASKELKEGVRVHKIIDSYTDSNKIVTKSKARLKEKGLLKSIVIDLTYDYLLTKNWEKFCNIPIEKFSYDFYTKANKRAIYFPKKANTLIKGLIKRDLLNKYQDLEHLKIAFERIDLRLSKRLLARDTAISYYDAVCNNIILLEEDFLEFFPMLCDIVKKEINRKKIKHWKI